MSSAQYIAKVNAHMKRRVQLLSALDKAISQVGRENVAMSLVDKAKVSA